MIQFVATAIKMKSGSYYSNNLLEIDEICLTNSKGNYWYKKEAIHDYVKTNPNTIAVKSIYGPCVIPAISSNGEKYVKSSPNDTTRDNLLNLPKK